jgi:hypothetical protein
MAAPLNSGLLGHPNPSTTEWINGRMHSSNYVILAVILAVAFAYPLRPWPSIWGLGNPAVSVQTDLAAIAVFLALVFGGGLLLAVGLPRGGSIGLNEEGVTIALGSRARSLGSRRFYRWEEVELRGHRLILRRWNWELIRYFLLNDDQVEGVARWMPTLNPDVPG